MANIQLSSEARPSIIKTAKTILDSSDSVQEMVCQLIKDADKFNVSALIFVQSAIQQEKDITGGYKSWRGTGNHNDYRIVNAVQSASNTVNAKFRRAGIESNEHMNNVNKLATDIACFDGSLIDESISLLQQSQEISEDIKMAIVTYNIKELRLDLMELGRVKDEYQSLAKTFNELDKNSQPETTDQPADKPADKPEATTDDSQKIDTTNEGDGQGEQVQPDDVTLTLEQAIHRVIELCQSDADRQYAIDTIADALEMKPAVNA